MVKLYEKRVAIIEIAKVTGFSQQTILNQLRKAGVSIRMVGRGTTRVKPGSGSITSKEYQKIKDDEIEQARKLEDEALASYDLPRRENP